MITYRRLSFFVYAIAIISIFGCQSLNPNNMSPDFKRLSFGNTNKILKISNIEITGDKIKGAENEFFMEDVDKKTFRKALILTLSESNLFSSVISSDDNCDLKLNCIILTQGQKIKVHDYFHNSVTSALVVKYSLVNERNGHIIFEIQIPSSGNADWGDSFNSFIVANTSLERAIKKNFTSFVEKMSEIKELYE